MIRKLRPLEDILHEEGVSQWLGSEVILKDSAISYSLFRCFNGFIEIGEIIANGRFTYAFNEMKLSWLEPLKEEVKKLYGKKLYAFECIMGHKSSNGVIHCAYGEIRFAQNEICLFSQNPNYWRRCESADLELK